jgi:hypothetical protein
MIKDAKKTAWQATYWSGDEEHDFTGWDVWLPDGRRVPQVTKTYRYLGSEEANGWKHATGGNTHSARREAESGSTARASCGP